MKKEDQRSDKRIIGIIVYVLTVVTIMVAAVVCCYRKQGMHEDEFYSFYSSNRTYGLIAEGEVLRNTVMDELTVKGGEGFNFSLVKEVQSWDVHPPVYYFVLHFICSLMPGVFSMWQGLCINLLCLLISTVLMKRLGDNLFSPPADLPETEATKYCRGNVVSLVILAWGLSAGTLTGVVFIRMYMLLTVWILAVTVLHLSDRFRDKEDPSGPLVNWFWPVLGAITFLGFMTHYYFFIWMFFLAVFWNIREIIRTRSIKTTLIYGLTMVVSFGLCYLFYPAFPAQMFRGQRGAQATGNFIDMANTGERVGFFAEKINRIGFGGILWVLLGAIVVLSLMAMDKRRGVWPRAARWRAGDKPYRKLCLPIKYDEADEAVLNLIYPEEETEGSSERSEKTGSLHESRRKKTDTPSSDLRILVCSAVMYVLIVSKTALLLGDSSIRYQLPVLPILYLCVFAGFYRVVLNLVSEEKYRIRLGIMGTVTVIVTALNIVSDFGGNISFLYPEKADNKQILAEYADADVYYIYPSGQSWIAWADMTELLMFDKVNYIADETDDSIVGGKAVIFAEKGIDDLGDEGLKELFEGQYSNVYATY